MQGSILYQPPILDSEQFGINQFWIGDFLYSEEKVT